MPTIIPPPTPSKSPPTSISPDDPLARPEVPLASSSQEGPLPASSKVPPLTQSETSSHSVSATLHPMPLKKSLFLKILKYIGLLLLSLVIAFFIVSLIVYFLLGCGCGGTSPHNREATNINTLSAGVKNVYAGSNNFNKLSNDILILAKAAPDKMVMGPTTLLNGYGGPVEVESTSLPINGESVSNNAYKITYTEVPSTDCARLVTGVGNNFVQLIVNGQILKHYPSQDKVSVEAASKACSEEKNTIVFYGN